VKCHIIFFIQIIWFKKEIYNDLTWIFYPSIYILTAHGAHIIIISGILKGLIYYQNLVKFSFERKFSLRNQKILFVNWFSNLKAMIWMHCRLWKQSQIGSECMTAHPMVLRLSQQLMIFSLLWEQSSNLRFISRCI
jgi:hypothetical protein